jgi:hypothetical protein
MVQHGPKEFAPINMPRNCNAGILPAKLKRRPRSAGILPAFFGARGSGRTSAVSAGALRASASVVLPKGGPSRAASCTLEACATKAGSLRYKKRNCALQELEACATRGRSARRHSRKSVPRAQEACALQSNLLRYGPTTIHADDFGLAALL